MADALSDAIFAILSEDSAQLSLRLDEQPALVSETASEELFLEVIAHQIYRGDTLLHIAAAAFQTGIVTDLLRRGADVTVRNRRGAQPLHYAADANRYLPEAQAATIKVLLEAGADPNSRDRDGTTPLHRAIRKRGSAAVKTLLVGGADVQLKNGNGSTPMTLAQLATGRSGSGTPEAKAEQAEIIRLLTGAGAT